MGSECVFFLFFPLILCLYLMFYHLRLKPDEKLPFVKCCGRNTAVEQRVKNVIEYFKRIIGQGTILEFAPLNFKYSSMTEMGFLKIILTLINICWNYQSSSFP